jgi:hypothetical protein
MTIIIRALKEVFNFFCGDWRIFWGVIATIVLAELVINFATFTYAKSFAGAIFVIGVSLSLIIALRTEIG